MQIGDRVEVKDTCKSETLRGKRGKVTHKSMVVGLWGVQFTPDLGHWISELDLKVIPSDGTEKERA